MMYEDEKLLFLFYLTLHKYKCLKFEKQRREGV